MAAKMTLQDIFNDDAFGLLEVKAPIATARNADERLLTSFAEINAFYKVNQREPQLGGGIQEHGLASRLVGIRSDVSKMEMLKQLDQFGLLNTTTKEINSLDDIWEDDLLGLLSDDDMGLFDFNHVQRPDERASSDFVARRKPCVDFNNYESHFKAVHKDLKEGSRSFVEFKQGNLKEGAYYLHNGVLFYLEKINISQNEHYKSDGTRVREDGRTRCIFENGTESNMLKRSVEKILYANGKAITERNDTSNDQFHQHFSGITDQDQQAGYIYILKSKSDKPEIRDIKHLYKIGFSTTTVEERIKNAAQEPTYLMADVRIVMTFNCFNMNTHKLELLLHNFFGSSCLNVDVFDSFGNRHTPREWFIAPLDIIEQAVQLILSGEIVGCRYDGEREEIV